METGEKNRFSFGDFRTDDALITVYSLLCALERFYASSGHLLHRETPRLQLLNRIASGVEIELVSSGIWQLYAADLIYIGEEPNIGIRSRLPGKNQTAVNFTWGRPSLKPLRQICGAGAGRYRMGIGIALGRKSYRAAWYAPEKTLRLRMEHYFPRWAVCCTSFLTVGSFQNPVVIH